MAVKRSKEGSRFREVAKTALLEAKYRQPPIHRRQYSEQDYYNLFVKIQATAREGFIGPGRKGISDIGFFRELSAQQKS
ncbi:hypothetical protein CEXT_686961 [Caerostris extrusa]|uniref:Uncharacterized protein n=1 Tax=Caerostris extrusa TaxID=172846 RepID=A0AAV4X2I0_CAEEX|nr:hypothetical protein CEXT_686961 [Caerostris extrusa]